MPTENSHSIRQPTLIAALLVCSPFAAYSRADVQPARDSPVAEEDDAGTFQWREATEQSLFLLTIQHGFRLTQEKTRSQLRGPFFADYAQSVSGLGGWSDGDSTFTNYVAHPMQGAAAGYIFVQNDPKSAGVRFSLDSRYWQSRLKATGWSALYSLQFELGPYSEATIGNVGMTPGTMGFVDLTVTPVAGLGWMLAEDALDRFVVERLERKVRNRALIRTLRMVCSPTRSFSTALGFQKPWRRDRARGSGAHPLAGARQR